MQGPFPVWLHPCARARHMLATPAAVFLSKLGSCSIPVLQIWCQQEALHYCKGTEEQRKVQQDLRSETVFLLLLPWVE